MLGLAMVGMVGVSQAAILPLAFNDENPDLFSTLQINGGISTVGVQFPMLCGNTSNAVLAGTRIAPVLPGVNGSSGDFKFGGMTGGATSSLGGVGGWNFRGNGLTMAPNAGLICYVLDSSGVRKASYGLFTDGLESTATPNATVLTRVLSLPDFDNNYQFKYLVDMTIPAEFAGKSYVIRDGFDSSVFDSGSSRFCEAALGATTCTVTPTQNSIDVLSTVPAGGISRRFVVQRPLRSGVFQLPANPNLMLTSAALFVSCDPSPTAPPGCVEIEEANLADNVSAGRGVLSDLLPVITTAPNMVGVLNEGSGATDVRFVISDDTSEIGLNPLNATVNISFNGALMPATNLSCAQQEIPQPGEQIRRTCRFDIPVYDPNFATDSVAGTFVQGVQASIIITAVDSRNQSSTKSVPLHIVSLDNDPPSFSLSPIAIPDEGNGKLPTVSCDLNQQPPYPEQCLGQITNFILNRKPGPPGAADENATQTAFFAGVDASNKLSCTGSIPSIFATAFPGGLQSPKYITSGSQLGLQYQLSAAPGYADCWIVVGDTGLPAGQSYNQSQILFRIKVD
ncbi:hypothetical protein DFR29_10777 [Tahibacter aquaticus]|uniref:Uncharacterized protein n=1 Tax=Tahibacter aquaticus TaxID=520092 RepID=A0A4R6YWC9_9GAMM|nr:hypothetical protein [Tahibacter aquaticus]TDR43071.1 hypothetical protein DFR29_10777 [Tahibacter aquaticus]